MARGLAGSLLLLAALVLLAPVQPLRADPGSGERQVAGRMDEPEAGAFPADELIGLLLARLEDPDSSYSSDGRVRIGSELYRKETRQREELAPPSARKAFDTPAGLLKQVRRFRESLRLSDSGLRGYLTVHAFKAGEHTFALPRMRFGAPLTGPSVPVPHEVRAAEEIIGRELREMFGRLEIDDRNDYRALYEGWQKEIDRRRAAILAKTQQPLRTLAQERTEADRRFDPRRSRLNSRIGSNVTAREVKEIETSRDLWLAFFRQSFIYNVNPYYRAPSSSDRQGPPAAEEEDRSEEQEAEVASLFSRGHPAYHPLYFPDLDEDLRKELTDLAAIKNELFNLGVFLPLSPETAALYETELLDALSEFPGLWSRLHRDRKEQFTDAGERSGLRDAAALAPAAMLISYLTPTYGQQTISLLDRYEHRLDERWAPRSLSANLKSLERQVDGFLRLTRGVLLYPELRDPLRAHLAAADPEAEADWGGLVREIAPLASCLEGAPGLEHLRELIASPRQPVDER